jgi:LacI family transcriptional regulator/LacI family repressor for deo operon, udp, cdd, tsx, nupC, and nupG
VTCYNDLVALGVCRALAELGISVPGDVSVIGCDDLQLLEYLPLRLTTIRIPKFEMGQRAAQMLVRHIESREALPPQKVSLEAELVVRDSTRPPAGAAAATRSALVQVPAGDGDGASDATGRVPTVAAR